jgi:hypothetical protein
MMRRSVCFQATTSKKGEENLKTNHNHTHQSFDSIQKKELNGTDTSYTCVQMIHFKAGDVNPTCRHIGPHSDVTLQTTSLPDAFLLSF